MTDECCAAWAVEVVAAWARGYCAEDGATIPHSEVLNLGRLCGMATAELQETARVHGGFVLQQRPGSDEWQVSAPNETIAQFSASASDVSDAARLLAAIPHYLQDHWWQQQQQQEPSPGRCVLSSAQQLVVSRLAQVVFDAQTATGDGDGLDPMMCVAAFRAATGRAPSGPADLHCVRQVWVAEAARMHRQLRRSSRATRVRVDYRDIIDGGGQGARGATEKRAAVSGAARSGGEKRARGAPETATPIAAQIDASGEIVRVKTADNRPDAALVVRAAGFVSLVFPRMEHEPPHCLTDPRVSKQQGRTRRQAQAVHEFATDGFPVPIDPSQWLQLQRSKYAKWLLKALSCQSVTVANEVQNRRCYIWEPFGAAMCRGCVARKSDCYCRFNNVRMTTTIAIVLASGESVTRYLLAPIFCDEKRTAKSYRMQVSPLRVPDWCRSPGTMGSTDSLSSLSDLGGGGSSTESEEDYDDDDVCKGRGGGGRGGRSRHCHRRKPDEWPEFYSLLMMATTLQPALDAIRPLVDDDEHVLADGSIEYPPHPQLGCSGAPCVRRLQVPGLRQFCDVCSTSIMGAHYMCAVCAVEICPQCYAEWDDSDVETRVVDHDQGCAALPIALCKRLGRSGSRLRGAALHQRRQFLRVSLVSMADVDAVAQKTREMAAWFQDSLMADVDCGGPVSASEKCAFGARVLRLCQSSRQVHRLAPWELPVVSVAPGELSTREFSRLWRRGQVVVVRGLLDDLDGSIWKPEWWIRNFGYEMVSVLDCARGAEPVGEWPLRDFYRLFDGPADAHSALFDQTMEDTSDWPAHCDCVRSSILKLKDWPPADDFQTRLPNHFARFMAALPFPEYTQRRGQFNMASRLPAEFVPPDLGPKMYCAYGSSDAEGGVGTTNLHCDMADAVNVMAYAAPRDSGTAAPAAGAAAVWDIYPPESVENLRTYIRELKAALGEDVDDPIHDQSTFLTEPQRQELYERFGMAGTCYRVFQSPGDAVFVPAGSAHQVCNYASAVKIAMDFVSPERVDHCRRLSGEFRKLNPAHPRNRDLLQLNSILWWAFAGPQ
ncbi:hypothetical protein H4R19_003754 [Coemansia spiralis]|nr:hypothetical protein H4R19_003754 [Coemansia spiralis]